VPKQLQTRGPATIREFVPDDVGHPAQHIGHELFNRVKVYERGPDTQVDVFHRDMHIGSLKVPREAEVETICRLFGEVEERRADRATFQVLLQGFEDAVLSGKPDRVVQAWRRVMAVFDTMAADVASLSGLPKQGSSAA